MAFSFLRALGFNGYNQWHPVLRELCLQNARNATDESPQNGASIHIRLNASAARRLQFSLCFRTGKMSSDRVKPNARYVREHIMSTGIEITRKLPAFAEIF